MKLIGIMLIMVMLIVFLFLMTIVNIITTKSDMGRRWTPFESGTTICTTSWYRHLCLIFPLTNKSIILPHRSENTSMATTKNKARQGAPSTVRAKKKESSCLIREERERERERPAFGPYIYRLSTTHDEAFTTTNGGSN
jgi:hypothetical protein